MALGRKSWLFCGFDRGGRARRRPMYTLIVTAKMNSVDLQAWLADVLTRIAAHLAHRLVELLPWNWRASNNTAPALAASSRKSGPAALRRVFTRQISWCP